MKTSDRIIKRIFDISLSFFGLVTLGLFIISLAVLSYLDTKQSGIFKQKRVGHFGNKFYIYKLRTMKHLPNNNKITTAFGHFLRTMKWDELPQLWNVLKGDMSFVGPRPDIEGFADTLEGGDRIILSIKPGITGPASLYFKNEEVLLEQQPKPDEYNRKVIWPQKVRLNKAYIEQYSFSKDLKIIFKTIFNT
ncbi:sugar transferase [Aestuariivivens marinum]|uniref:sugar transferase n=1 Tax=Aestuariivivens marinum TaxID=2913555 RepID=UPI001F5630ED|nr:sugar transferase [Aestuariivivens marinum]